MLGMHGFYSPHADVKDSPDTSNRDFGRKACIAASRMHIDAYKVQTDTLEAAVEYYNFHGAVVSTKILPSVMSSFLGCTLVAVSLWLICS